MSLPEPKWFDDVCGKSVAAMCCIVAVLIESRENAAVKILVPGDFWISVFLNQRRRREQQRPRRRTIWTTTTTPRIWERGRDRGG